MRTLLAALLVVGCSKSDPGPSCDQVVDQMLAVTKQELTGHGKLELGNRKMMLDTCESRHLSKEARQCYVAAKSLTDMGNCQKLAMPAGAGSARPAP